MASRKLLVADDSVTIQKVIKLALAAEGYDVLAVSDGNEATRAIEEEKPDVVLIDVALPIADACQVKKRINGKPELYGTKFILLASAFEKIDERAIEAAQFHGRLIKPFDPAHLRKMVADAIASIPSSATTSAAPAPVEDLPAPVSSFLEIEAEANFVEPTVQFETKDDLPPLTDNIPTVEPEQENDIRNLTESTIKMSGLDEWNLDDSRRLKTPETVPAPPKPPAAPKARAVAVAEIPAAALVTNSLPPSPPPPVMKGVAKNFDSGGSTFLKTSKIEPKVDLKGSRERDMDFTREPQVPVPPLDITPASPTLSKEEMESLLRRELNPIIEKLARELVPHMAEDLIKKEIERILAEP